MNLVTSSYCCLALLCWSLLAWLVDCELDPADLKIIYPYKQFQIFGNEIAALIHVPETLDTTGRVCVMLNNATEPLNVRRRTLISSCVNMTESNVNGATTIHLSFYVPFKTNILLSLSVTRDMPFEATALPNRLEAKIHDTRLMLLQSDDRLEEPENYRYKILYPKNGQTVETNENNDLYVYFFAQKQSRNDIVCLTIDHQYMHRRCVLQDSLQPIHFENQLDKSDHRLHVITLERVLNTSKHFLSPDQKYHHSDENFEIVDSILFMSHQVIQPLPRITVVSPKPHDIILSAKNVSSVVYFKFLLSGMKGFSSTSDTNDQNGFLLCFSVEEFNEQKNEIGETNRTIVKTCNALTAEPMQLMGLKPGNYTVTAFLSNLIEGEIMNTRTVPILFSITEDVTPSMDIELKSNGENVHRNTHIIDRKRLHCLPAIYTLHIFAYKRSLAPLLSSISTAYYDVCDGEIKINVVVFIDIGVKPDKSIGDKIIHEVREFKTSWEYGSVRYLLASEPLGLVQNIERSFEIYTEDDVNSRAILLEDDIVVSKYFMYYILQVDSYLQRTIVDREAMGGHGYAGATIGISLYRPDWNDIKWCRIDRNKYNEDNSVYLYQLPSSWGALYYVKEWKRYKRWIKKKLGAKGNANHYYIPESMSNNWKISWKLPLLYYMIMTDKYMIYPSMVSLSTTLAPPGENIKDDSLKYMYNVKLFDDIDAKDTMLTLFDNDSFGDFALLRRYDVYHNLVHQHYYVSHVSKYWQSQALKVMQRKSSSFAHCEEDIESVWCEFSNVTFSIHRNAKTENYNIIMFNNYLSSVMPTVLFPNSFRHRCCMEEIPDNIAVKQTPGSYDFVNGNATSEARYKMCGSLPGTTYMFSLVNFPQHGHTLHDTAFSLFVTMHEHNHPGAMRFILTNANDNNIQNIDHLQQYYPVLYGLLQSLGNKPSNMYMLSQFSNQQLCIDHLVYGLSSRASFYNSNDFYQMKKKHLKPFLSLYRKALGFEFIQSPIPKGQRTIHFIRRKTRVVMNQKDLVRLCEQYYGYNAIEVIFETLSLKEQVAFMRNVNVLVGATGTGLFNLLFMENQIPAEAQNHIVIFFPYGTYPYMGSNIINMARFLNFQVHVIESKRANQSEFLAVNVPSEILLRFEPSQIWNDNWLNGYTLYMQQNFYIDVHDFESVLKAL